MDKKQRAAFDKINQRVAEAGGIAVIPMWELRDAGGWAKLGVNVVVILANLLDEAGLGTLPVGQQLPLDQAGAVRVYQQKSSIGAVVEAVIKPSGKGDETLRRLTSDDAADVLDQVRSLVCG